MGLTSRVSRRSTRVVMFSQWLISARDVYIRPYAELDWCPFVECGESCFFFKELTTFSSLHWNAVDIAMIEVQSRVPSNLFYLVVGLKFRAFEIFAQLAGIG